MTQSGDRQIAGAITEIMVLGVELPLYRPLHLDPLVVGKCRKCPHTIGVHWPSHGDESGGDSCAEA
jgi:hypothetical protein